MLAETVKELVWVKEKIAELKEREQILKEKIHEELQRQGKDVFVLDGIGAVVRRQYVQKRFSKKKLQEEYPELYERFLEEKEVDGIWAYTWESWQKNLERMSE